MNDASSAERASKAADSDKKQNNNKKFTKESISGKSSEPDNQKKISAADKFKTTTNTHEQITKIDGQIKTKVENILGIVDLGATNEDTIMRITTAQLIAQASDIDNDTLTVHTLVLTDASQGSLIDNTDRTWQFTPSENFHGYDVALTYFISDGTTDAAGAAVIDVIAVNDAPTAKDNTLTLLEDNSHTFSASEFGFVDIEGDNLVSIQIKALPVNGAFTLSHLAVTQNQIIATADIVNLVYTPESNANGATYSSVKFTVSDGRANSSERTITFNVAAINDSPVMDNNTLTIIEGETLVLSVEHLSASDVDNDDRDLIFTLSNIKQGVIIGTIDRGGSTVNFTQQQLSDGKISFAHDGGEVAPSFDVIVNDRNSITRLAAATIHFNSKNEVPITHQVDLGDIDEDTAVTITTEKLLANAADEEGDTLTISSLKLSDETKGMIADNGDGTWRYTPMADFNNDNVALTYFISDGTTNATGTAVIDVIAVNDAPTAKDNTLTLLEDNSHTFAASELGFEDIEGDNLVSIRIKALPANGVLNLNDLAVTQNQIIATDDIVNLIYTPENNANGATYSSVKFTVNDGQTDSIEKTITFNIDAVNDRPVLLVQSFANEGELIAAYSFTDTSDASGNDHPLTYTGSATTGLGYNGSDSALIMDGTNGSAEIAGLSTGGAMTISAWVKFDSFDQSWSRVVDFSSGDGDNNILIGHVTKTNTLGFHIFSGGSVVGQLDVSNFFDIGQWVYMTATIDDTGLMRVYKNGEVKGESQGTVPVEKIRSGNYIGKSHFANDGYLDGAIDELVLFNNALTGDQVSELYRLGSVDALVNYAFHIDKNTANNTLVGKVSAVDIDTSSLTYSLTNNAKGKFLIDASTGEIRVADSTLLTDEAAISHTVTVQASDGNLTASRDYTINLGNVNESPIIGNAALTLSEGETVILTDAYLSASDEDHDDASLLFTLSNINQGAVVGATDNGNGTFSFTQQQITDGAISFVHNGSERPPAYDVSVSDGSITTKAATVTIHFTSNPQVVIPFSHSESFEKSPDDWLESIESFYKPGTNWYMDNYHLAKYGAYTYLHKTYQGYLPTGQQLTLLQAESGHTPENVGTVKHLVQLKASNSHSKAVANILNQLDTYPLLYTPFKTYSTGLIQFHTIDTADLRQFVQTQMTESSPYFTTDYLGGSILTPKLLNISNTNGGSDLATVNQIDRFIYLNDMLACTAHSSLIEGNWTTSGNAYNSLVVDSQWGNWVGSKKYEGTILNAHGTRQKPDLTAFASRTASSYSTPTVCSGAAILLERAYVDNDLANARQSIVIKSILMAGATRYNYKVSTEWGDGISQASVSALPSGEWLRVSDSNPLSQRYGAGVMNIHAAYLILDGGEQPKNSLVNNIGWNYQQNIEANTTTDYRFKFQSPRQFSALMTWHREVDSNSTSHLADFKMELYHMDVDSSTPIAISDNTSSNVELIEIPVVAGNYHLKITLKNAGGAQFPQYGLAWNHKERVPTVDYFDKNRDDEGYNISWGFHNTNNSDYKYRLRISSDENHQNVLDEVYLLRTDYVYKDTNSAQAKFFQLDTYPLDENVALQYPSIFLPYSTPVN